MTLQAQTYQHELLRRFEYSLRTEDLPCNSSASQKKPPKLLHLPFPNWGSETPHFAAGDRNTFSSLKALHKGRSQLHRPRNKYREACYCYRTHSPFRYFQVLCFQHLQGSEDISPIFLLSDSIIKFPKLIGIYRRIGDKICK